MWSHSSSSQASSVSRPRVVGDAVIIGKATVLARRVARSGCWEVEKPHPVALSRLLTLAYGKRISSGSDMVKLLEKAFTTLPRNLREADQLISALPEPLIEAEDRVEAANRLLKDGVSPYHLEEALRGEQLGLRPAPAWAERLTLCDKGVVLGKGTVIVGLTDLPHGGTAFNLEGKEADILALLSVARRGLAPAEMLTKLAAASRALTEGDISRAAIALAQTDQPALTDDALAKALTFATNRLKRGMKPLALLKTAGFSLTALQKAYGGTAMWDENQHPRDDQGRFSNGAGGTGSRSSNNVTSRQSGTSISDVMTVAADGKQVDLSDLTHRNDTADDGRGQNYPLDRQYASNDAGKQEVASDATAQPTPLKSGVDWSFVNARENGEKNDAKPILAGYVPSDSSGVTIASGFDVGHHSVDDLRKMGLSEEIVKKLEPYCASDEGRPLTGDNALKELHSKPLAITADEAKIIDDCSHRDEFTKVENAYNSTIDKKNGVKFADLPPEAQTVIASFYFQYGNNYKRFSRTKKLWGAFIKRDWSGAVKILRSFTIYKERRSLEADLLKECIR